MTDFSPGLVPILGALAVPFLHGRLRAAWMLVLPAVALALLLSLEPGAHGRIDLFGMTLVTLRVDALSLLFAGVFLVSAMLGIVYAFHVREAAHDAAILVYAGCGVGAVLAGDLVTLFVFWEGSTLASAALIFCARDARSYRAGMRYLLIQIGSGVALLAGAVVHYVDTGSIAFDGLDPGSRGGLLILGAFGVKAAFPLLNAWLKDAYPAAPVTATVILSGITTKLAVYALLRGFPGAEILVPVGAIMAIVPALFALVENDVRRILSYSLNSQLGFMVAGIGIGTELSMAGSAAHAASSAIYQPLLFMAAGAVILRTGTADAAEPGGLARSMRWTAAFCLIGVASLSALPLFPGFVAKAMVVTAAMEEGYFALWLVLLAAGAAAVVHTGIRVPYVLFFGPDRGGRPAEAPPHMLLAMGAASLLCLGIGILPGLFYGVLPFPVDYAAYTIEHVVTQLQLLVFAALAFVVMKRAGLYSERPGILLDVDWIYCRLLGGAAVRLIDTAADLRARITRTVEAQVTLLFRGIYRHHGPAGILARSWPTGSMAFWAVFLLGAYLVLAYF